MVTIRYGDGKAISAAAAAQTYRESRPIMMEKKLDLNYMPDDLQSFYWRASI